MNRPGWKTTEFWLSLAVTLWGAVGHTLSPTAQAVVTAVVPAAYAVARAVAKRGATPPVVNAPSVTVGNP